MITVNPGHFHAGLVYKYAYDRVDPVVHIYAPGGKDLESHLALIDRFNARKDRPTAWIPEVYEGEDYLERMLSDRSGNNRRKIEYIRRAVEGGINVLADKPMVIRPDDFPVLKDALELADEKGLVVNDIMTERLEITSILQRELSRMEDVFGELIPGRLLIQTIC